MNRYLFLSAIIGLFALNIGAYEIYVPESVRGVEKPALVVLIHGCTQDAEEFMRVTKMREEADKRGFIILAPQKDRQLLPPNNPLECWAWYWPNANKRDPNRGELKRIMDLVHKAKNEHGVDDERVYTVGFSAGAVMSSIMSACYPDVFSGALIHSGIAYSGLRYGLGRKIRLEDVIADDRKISMKELSQQLPLFARKRAQKLRSRALECGKDVDISKHRLKTVIIFQGKKDTVAWDRHGPNIFFQFTTNEGTVQTRRNQQMSIAEFESSQRKVMLYELYGMGHGWSGGKTDERFSYPAGIDATTIGLDRFGL